jgi:S1-C subfamily serine protease
VIGHGGRAHSLRTRIIAKQEFAGYWEYVLDEALFTAPAHPQWGGAALLDAQGNLIGTGSLLVQQEVQGEMIHVNMFVPIDLLAPIFDAMVKTGRSPHPPRPWLGMSTQDPAGKLVVARLSPNGPASRAGVHIGDLVLGVGQTRVHSLVEFFRAVWKVGQAGVEVPLTLSRGGDVLHITVKSADRNDFLRKPKLH